jgi:hypothetical protein
MTGWLADFFRLAGGLLYWNTRKSWFQLRRGRARCPCQSPSDSGRALETQCEACLHWARVERFRRVCPLLVPTPGGWRCSANTADVRPFWGRAFGYYGGALAALYLTGVIGIFGFLRTVGYPVSIVHVAWPPSWHRVGEARGWFFMEKARRAFAANRPGEAILDLSNAYEFDPRNYIAGLTLAKTLQAGQPVVSNRLYERLLHEHPAQHETTAQEWLRALLARGDFDAVSALARDEVLAASPHASAWMRALVFATHQSRHDASLRALRDSPRLVATMWRPLLDTELLLLAGRNSEARTFLDRADWSQVPPYGVYYEVSVLTDLGDVFAALDLLGRSGAQLDDETRVTLQLAAYAQQGAERPLQRLADQLLGQKLSLPVIKILAAQLIRYPNAPLLDQTCARFRAEQIAFTTESSGAVFALLCAAGVNADWPRFHELRQLIMAHGGASQAFLTAVEAFFRGTSSSTRITSFLPVLPLPLEVNYALIARYPGAAAPAVSPSKLRAVSGPALSKRSASVVSPPALSLSNGPNPSNGPSSSQP